MSACDRAGRGGGLTLEYSGPVSHGKTVSLAVSPTDPGTFAVTGWPGPGPLHANGGNEEIWLTADAGETWVNATLNLRAAIAPAARARPSALAFVPLQPYTSGLLCGTTAGVFVSIVRTSAEGTAEVSPWTRLGEYDGGFPLVLVGDLVYNLMQDMVTAATLGRGAWVLEQASKVIGAVDRNHLRGSRAAALGGTARGRMAAALRGE